MLEQCISRETRGQGQESAGTLFGGHQTADLDIRETQVGSDHGEDDRKYLLIPNVRLHGQKSASQVGIFDPAEVVPGPVAGSLGLIERLPNDFS